MQLRSLLLLPLVLTGVVAFGAENPCYSLTTCKSYPMKNFTLPGAPVDGAFKCAQTVAVKYAPPNPLLGAPVVSKVNSLENPELSNGYSYGTAQTYTYLPKQCGGVTHANPITPPPHVPGQPQRPIIPIYVPYIIPNPDIDTDPFGNAPPATIQMPCGYYYRNIPCPSNSGPGT